METGLPVKTGMPIRAVMSDVENYTDWTDSHPNLGEDDRYDECFIQAMSESDMPDCHQNHVKHCLKHKTEGRWIRCCTLHMTYKFIHERAKELYDKMS